MRDDVAQDAITASPPAPLMAALGRRAIVLVGMMGAGKSSIGRRLAQLLQGDDPLAAPAHDVQSLG